jgi:copper(I)-binding protein
MKTYTLKLSHLFAAGFLSFSAMANQATDLEVENPFVREMPPMAPATGAFMTFINPTESEITVIKAQSDAAKKVELHTHIHDNGVMRMREIPEIKVPAMGQAELKPGGLHIMLINPTRKLTEGDRVDIVITFQDGSEKVIQAPVRKIMGMGQHRGPGHHGQGMMHQH